MIQNHLYTDGSKPVTPISSLGNQKGRRSDNKLMTFPMLTDAEKSEMVTWTSIFKEIM